jgi:sugar-specific transcriptional regulator TrmB
MPTAAELLAEFGLTGLEAEIYAFLVQEWPASGYRIAQAIRKPAANTYKSLETLEQKGVILVELGEKRRYKPVLPEELFSRWDKERSQSLKSLAKLLSTPPAETPDERVYLCRSRALAIGRAQAWIQGAETEVLVVADPATAEPLQEDSQAAVLRDINVIFAMSSTEGLRVVVDGSKALLGSGEDYFVSENPVFASETRHGLRSQIALRRIQQHLEEGAGGKRIAKFIANMDAELGG